MFVAIVGTRCSGKSTVRDFLINKGFQPVQLLCLAFGSGHQTPDLNANANLEHHKDLYPITSNPAPTKSSVPNTTQFTSPQQLLDHVTSYWRSNFVTTDLNTPDLVEMFARRPFFMLISIDAPLLDRFRRLNFSTHISISLEDFVEENDNMVYGSRHLGTQTSLSAINNLEGLIKLHLINSFKSIQALHSHLETLDILSTARLRPSWDDYFMTLAMLASKRSNCMKRRVGAILVRENRIVATGYNGTPRGLTNCNEGGCAQCNGSSQSLECVCLHAEENALLEASHERVGEGATLYCNTCPCLKCTVKIIQTGVKEVIYNLSYKVDDASAKLFKEAGVTLRRHNTNSDC